MRPRTRSPHCHTLNSRVSLRHAQARPMPEKLDQQSGTSKSHVKGLNKTGSPVAPPASHPVQPTRYLAWLYSPPLQRPVLAALCAIETEIATSLRAGLDHHVAHTR